MPARRTEGSDGSVAGAGAHFNLLQWCCGAVIVIAVIAIAIVGSAIVLFPLVCWFVRVSTRLSIGSASPSIGARIPVICGPCNWSRLQGSMHFGKLTWLLPRCFWAIHSIRQGSRFLPRSSRSSHSDHNQLSSYTRQSPLAGDSRVRRSALCVRLISNPFTSSKSPASIMLGSVRPEMLPGKQLCFVFV